MKNYVLKIISVKELQFFWEFLFRISKIGMNYWGGSSVNNSGESSVLSYIENKLLGQNEIILFDVGANDGDYALMVNNVINKGVKVFSFEPSKFTYEELVKRTNNIAAISCHNIGFGAKVEKIKLYSSGDGSTIASLYDLKNPMLTFDSTATEEVNINTIDNFVQTNNIERIDFLKIDVEGHELFVLQGAKHLLAQKKIQFIQFEFGTCHVDSRTFFRDFIELLGTNYIFYRIVSNGLREISYYDSNSEVFGTANFFAELK